MELFMGDVDVGVRSDFVFFLIFLIFLILFVCLF